MHPKTKIFAVTKQLSLLALTPTSCASGQESNSCASLLNFRTSGVEITKAAAIAVGSTEPNPLGQGRSDPLPAYCRAEGGINFALAMPDKWNGDFLKQGGGGGNGVVLACAT